MKKFRMPNDSRGQGRGDNYGCFRYMLVPLIIVMLLIFLFATGCSCMAQIPTQVYFLNDSCEFYLPDYSQAIEIRDNCCVDSTIQFIQEPHSGTMITGGAEIQVTLTATDCYGNSRSMSFDVIGIDNTPPEFIYDSTEFIPTGHYQNEYRTWHFYTILDSAEMDEKGNIPMTHYHRSEPKIQGDRRTGYPCNQPQSYFVPYDSLPDGHPLKLY